MAKSVSNPISTRDPNISPRVDMGCDTDFAMYYSLFNTLNMCGPKHVFNICGH